MLVAALALDKHDQARLFVRLILAIALLLELFQASLIAKKNFIFHEIKQINKSNCYEVVRGVLGGLLATGLLQRLQLLSLLLDSAIQHLDLVLLLFGLHR